jgi:hypothetical protein
MEFIRMAKVAISSATLEWGLDHKEEIHGSVSSLLDACATAYTIETPNW